MSKFLTLDVGGTQATLAEYALQGKRNLTLLAYGSAPLDTQGIEGTEVDTLAPVIRQIMRETGIRNAPVIASVSGQMVFPRFVKLPVVPEDKREELLRSEVEQNVPFPIDDLVYAHQMLGKTTDGDDAAIIVAAKIDRVRAVTSAIRGAGLNPVRVDAGPMALYNVLKTATAGDASCKVLLDIGAKVTGLIITEGEKIYTRTIPVAGNSITREIASALGCSFEEADQIKRERGYVSLGGVTEDADEVTDRVSKVIRTVLTRLQAEISRSINFYRSQQGGQAPSRLYLTGGTAALPELDRFFSEALQVEVEYLNPLGLVKTGSKVNAEALGTDAFTLAGTVGLALRETDLPLLAADLMPPELVALARTKKRIPYLAVGGIALCAALGLGMVAEQSETAALAAQVECVKTVNAGLQRQAGLLKTAEDAAQTALEKSDAFQKLLCSRSQMLVRLETVRRALLPGMWLTEWTEDGADAVKITVRGWSDQLVAREAEYSAANKNVKRTAAEIVQLTLKNRAQVVGESVKVLAQRDVKGCLTEFSLGFAFAPPRSALANEAPKAAAKKKGAVK